MSTKSFAQAFCESFDIPPEHFVEAMLQRSLYPHARILLRPLCFCLRRRWLDRDREILDDLGHTVDIAEMKRLLSRLPWYYSASWNFRQEFRLRLSSRKILAVAHRIGFEKRRDARPRKVESVVLGAGVVSAA